LAALIAAFMLVGVLVVAWLLPAAPTSTSTSLLLDRTPTLAHVRLVFLRNLLVLAIHLAACYVGAVIGRPYQPLAGRWRRWGRWGRWHSELPAWMKHGALAYALTATLVSVVLQTIGLGFTLADLAATLHLSPARLLILVLPHAVPELVGVFLPLALFIIQARKGELEPLGLYARQAAALALPLVLVAAFIEVYLAPALIAHATVATPIIIHLI
jgi:hypothetical protein